MIEISALGRWTPVRLTIAPPEPIIDWCDLSDIAFTEPFFDQTLTRVFSGDRRQIACTALSGLGAIELIAPGRDPDGFIFHLPRCGSTLISQVASMLPDVGVLSEAGPVNTLLQLDPAQIDETIRIEYVRLLLRSFARGQPQAKTFLVKLSSWNIHYIGLLRRAFPATPWAFIYRQPAEVVASILAEKPAWFRLHEMPIQAARILGIPANEATKMDQTDFAVRAVGEFMQEALAANDRRALYIEYNQMPDVIWRRVLPFFGRPCSSSEIDVLKERARWHAKKPQQTFMSDGEIKRRSLSQCAAGLIEEQLAPLYTELKWCRAALHN